MSGIKVALSPPEAVQRFRDLVESISELHGELTPRIKSFLEEKAQTLSLHRVDMEKILQEVSELCQNSARSGMNTNKAQEGEGLPLNLENVRIVVHVGYIHPPGGPALIPTPGEEGTIETGEPSSPPLETEHETFLRNDSVSKWPFQTLEGGHGDWVSCLSLSLNDRMLASVGDDRVIRLWDLACGRLLRTLTFQQCNAHSVAISPDGQMIASASENMAIPVWDPQSGKLLRLLEGHKAEVTFVIFSPSGHTLASGDYDGTVCLWNPIDGRELWKQKMHECRINCLSFSQDCKIFASGSSDRNVRVWDLAIPKRLQSFGDYDDWDWIRCVSISPDGCILASGGDDKIVRLWNLKNGKSLPPLRGHEGWVRSLSFSPDGNILASAGDDNTIRIWELATGRLLLTLVGHEHWVRSISFSSDGRNLVSGANDGTIRFWNPTSGKLLLTLCLLPNGASLAFTPENYFDYSGDILNFVSFISGKEIKAWSYEHFAPHFHRPDLIRKILNRK